MYPTHPTHSSTPFPPIPTLPISPIFRHNIFLMLPCIISIYPTHPTHIPYTPHQSFTPFPTHIHQSPPYPSPPMFRRYMFWMFHCISVYHTHPTHVPYPTHPTHSSTSFPPISTHPHPTHIPQCLDVTFFQCYIV